MTLLDYFISFYTDIIDFFNLCNIYNSYSEQMGYLLDALIERTKEHHW